MTSYEEMNGNYTGPKFKVILIGESGVGKTSLFLRIRDDQFVEGGKLTLGTDSCNRRLKVDGKEIQISLWDTAGVERFRTLTRNFYRNAHAVLLVFNANEPSSLYYLSKWEQDAKEYAPTALRFLVGNKSDLERLVTQDGVEGFARSHDCEYAFVTSAKTGEGVRELMRSVTEKLLASYRTEKFDLENSWLDQSIHVNQGDSPELNNKSSCC